jgi:4-hydroxybenzoyl-CoA reductase subunit beta
MIPTNTYIRATSVEQAISMAQAHQGAFRYLAGGTDALVNKFQGNDEASVLIDISGIAALKQIVTGDSLLVIGSMVCLDDLEKHPVISGRIPALVEAAQSVASPTIRKTATLGGNLLCENRCTFYNQSAWWREAAGHCLKCHGTVCLATGGSKNCFSKFVSDTAVVLISLDAHIEVSGATGTTIIPLGSIYTGDGINPRQVSETAVIRSVHVQVGGNPKTIYKKLRKRESIDFTSLSTAVTLQDSGRIRIVMGGVHAKPVVVDGSAADNMNDLINLAVTTSRMVDNDTYSRAYRKEIISVFLERSFRELKLIHD